MKRELTTKVAFPRTVPSACDISDPTSVTVTIDDGFQAAYIRNLGDDAVVRSIKLTDEDDTQVTKLWVAYNRSEEDGFGSYAYDTQVNINVDVKGSTGVEMHQESYFFWTETKKARDAAEAARIAM